MQNDNNEEMFPIVDEEGNITGPAASATVEVNCFIR